MNTSLQIHSPSPSISFKKKYLSVSTGLLRFIFGVLLCCWGSVGSAQIQKSDFTLRDPLAGVARDSWLTPADSLHKGRFYLAAGTGTVLYSAASVGLYQTWYADFDRAPLRSFDDWTSNLGYISRERFGSNFFERYLKDYNAQTIWLSANPRSFLPKSKIPPWLNVAVGYGSENVYGAYSNTWREDGVSFRYRPERYRQWFLSPDIYLSRIPTKKRWVRLTLGILDFIKIPAPALEYSQGKFKGHWLMW